MRVEVVVTFAGLLTLSSGGGIGITDYSTPVLKNKMIPSAGLRQTTGCDRTVSVEHVFFLLSIPKARGGVLPFSGEKI